MEKVAIKQNKNQLSKREFDTWDHVILVLPPKDWPQIPYREILARRARKLGKDNGPLVTDLPNAHDTRVSWTSVKSDISSFELLTLARKLVASHWNAAPARIALAAPGVAPALAARVMEAVVAALLARAVPLPRFKSKDRPPRSLKSITIFGQTRKLDLSRTLAEAEGNHLARSLTLLPPTELTPTRYRERVGALAKEHGWRMEFFDIKALRRMKAGAFLAVAQGGAGQDDGIVHLRYQPKDKTRRTSLALVGKGICFDTGGHNLKPAKHMLGMHEDMAGSAVALGTLLALSRLKVDFTVDCWLALAQNMISPTAYKQNDVVTALNGTTIEIVHTDAEGRMVLADTLALASKAKPGMIIDYATLTGTCVYALGTQYSGAFTNRREFVDPIIAAGVAAGERVWPFPTDADFDKGLESDIADVKQCSLEGDADHILAARFLTRFVDAKIPWVHLDLASAINKGGLAHIPTATTGFGVRYTLNLLLDGRVFAAPKA
ncbi:MAG: leucyl aminopeptidase family protein [Gammaproteobacteria bacterium]